MTATMTAMDLFNCLTETEKTEVLQKLNLDKRKKDVCFEKGHNYKPIGKKLNWFAPPTIIMVCTKCGREIEK